MLLGEQDFPQMLARSCESEEAVIEAQPSSATCASQRRGQSTSDSGHLSARGLDTRNRACSRRLTQWPETDRLCSDVEGHLRTHAVQHVT